MAGGLENQSGLLGKGLDNRGGEGDTRESLQSGRAGRVLCKNTNRQEPCSLHQELRNASSGSELTLNWDSGELS